MNYPKGTSWHDSCRKIVGHENRGDDGGFCACKEGEHRPYKMDFIQHNKSREDPNNMRCHYLGPEICDHDKGEFAVLWKKSHNHEEYRCLKFDSSYGWEN